MLYTYTHDGALQEGGAIVACDQSYVDDVVVVDPKFGKSSAQLTLDYTFRLVGFPFAPRTR